MGWSPTFSTTLGVALPAAMGPFGFPGCVLYSGADAATVSAVLDASGEFEHTLGVPNLLKFCGMPLVYQALVLGPNSTASDPELLATNGLECIAGS